MRIINTIILFFYTVIFLVIGVCLIVLGFDLAGWVDLSAYLQTVISFPNLHWILIASGTLLILVTLSLATFSQKRYQQEKTIGYMTPGGQVIISLSAIEDFIRKLSFHVPDLKELRPEVIVTRRGIEVESRLVLWSTSHVPDVTEKVQELIRSHVQELLAGIDRPILVNVHIIKIEHRTNREDKKNRTEIPFIR